MKNKLTVKQYAAIEKESIAAINQRRYRGTLKWVVIDGLVYVYPKSDITIKKPRIIYI